MCTACQKIDWPEHKPKCNLLKGGRWVKVPFRMKQPGNEDCNVEFYSRTITNSPQDMEMIINKHLRVLRPFDPSANLAPPNVHGDKTFLVKIQLPPSVGFDPSGLMIYDRHRSFKEVFFCREDDPELYREFFAESHGPRTLSASKGRKMYRWARRTGEFELTICLDRKPSLDTMW